MTVHAARTPSSPVQVTLADLVRLRPAGESLKLTAPRIRVAVEGGHVSPYKGRGVEFDRGRRTLQVQRAIEHGPARLPRSQQGLMHS